MAAPQFFTPDSVRPSRPKRRFTLEQANRSLPLVKRVVADIVRMHGLVCQAQQELQHVMHGKNATNPPAAQGRLEVAMHKLEDYEDELAEIGCELKDRQTGLIDFVGRHQGRDVYLCWKLGEDRISHWHELDAGFAGRQPVAKLEEA
jgi:hypothetical protein